jgi:methyl-accepting chemotaxis protein
MLAKLSGTHVAKLTLGARRFDLVISPVVVEGQRTGTIVEWTDRTEELAQLERELALGREGRRVQQALDATTSQSLSQSSSEQAARVEETTASIEQMPPRSRRTPRTPRSPTAWRPRPPRKRPRAARR